MLELAIVLPTFNERENVGEVIRRLDAALAGLSYEVIVVDDDSADGTAEAVRDLARMDPRVRVLQRIHRKGLSSACVEGIMATAAPYVVVMDADGQHDEALVRAMLEKARSERLDLVVATRHTEGGSAAALSPWRALLSDAGKRLSRLVSSTPVSDPMSGFFLVERRFFEGVSRSLAAVGFKILLDIIASARGPVRVGELPYRFGSRLHGQSKLDALVGVEYLQLLVYKLVGDLIPPRFILFGFVGGFGVLLHLLILSAMLRWAGQPFFVAQLVATVLVMTSNFFINNILTWRDHRLKGVDAVIGLLKFYVACSIGALLNLQVAESALTRGAPWYLAGFAGLVVGSVWNFAVTASSTWKRRRRAASR